MSSFDITIEELRRRQRQHSTTPNEKRKRCPECGYAAVISKVPGSDGMGGAPREVDTAYRCGYCQSHFDNPVSPEGDR